MKENKFVKNLNIFDGKITYNDFDIDPNISFEDQKYSFKEDILQIKFGNRFVLDVGWRPEFDSTGFFIIQVIQDDDWIHPLLKFKCKNLNELKKTIEKASLIISAKKEDENLPYRNVEYDSFEEE